METLKSTRAPNALLEKIKDFLNPDRFFLIFTIISTSARSLINFFSSNNLLLGYTKFQATFFISAFLTFLFIFISFILSIDWYGKQKKDIVPAIRKWTRKNKYRNSLFFPFLFVFDPFLFFIYFKNGYQGTEWKILAWILLFFSLLLTGYIWLNLGKAKDAIGIIPFIIVIIVLLFYYRKLKKWAEVYLKEPEV
jgi:hypothetical protein